MINGINSALSSDVGWETQTFHPTSGTVAKPATLGTLPSRSVYQATPVWCPRDV